MANAIVKSQSFYRQQVFLPRMTGLVRIKHTNIAFSDGWSKMVLYKIRSMP